MAFKNHWVEYAFLKVFTQQPLSAQHPFWKLSRVTMTPRIAALTFPQQVVDIFADNYMRWRDDFALKHQLNFEKGISYLMNLDTVLEQVRACQICAAELPLGANPVVQAGKEARILIIGQAPGTRVHKTSIPWNDPSGDRLRQWLDIDKDVFYDPNQIAIVPMGFCYPGKGNSGDLPPRKECAPVWHKQILEQLPNIKLTLLIGQYSQQYYLINKPKTLTQTIQRWQDWGPDFIPLPHPSPRNTLWLKKNPWFEDEVVPYIRERVHSML